MKNEVIGIGDDESLNLRDRPYNLFSNLRENLAEHFMLSYQISSEHIEFGWVGGKSLSCIPFALCERDQDGSDCSLLNEIPFSDKSGSQRLHTEVAFLTVDFIRQNPMIQKMIVHIKTYRRGTSEDHPLKIGGRWPALMRTIRSWQKPWESTSC
jgi:hypothetical protein